MDESTGEPQARQAAAISGEIDQEVGENGVLVSGGGRRCKGFTESGGSGCGGVSDAGRRGRSTGIEVYTRSVKYKMLISLSPVDCLRLSTAPTTNH